MPKENTLWDRFASLLFPKTCVVCQKVVEYDTIWCGCDLPLYLTPTCAVCGESFGSCRCEAHSFQLAAAPFSYRDGVRDAILRLKEQADLRTARFLGEYMATLCGELFVETPPTVVVPVPMSAPQLKKRGYNQAQLIAEAIADILELPMQLDALRRADDSGTQHSLGKLERMENAVRSYSGVHTTSFASDTVVLLVDDVCTTGATLEACASLLVGLGAGRVLAVTAAGTDWENNASIH